MTLWQVLIVVALAWISGALFGAGLKDLLAARRPKTVAAPTQAVAAPVVETSSEGSTQAPIAQGSEPAQSPAEPARKRPSFWFADDAASPDGEIQEPAPEPVAQQAQPLRSEPAADAGPPADTRPDPDLKAASASSVEIDPSIAPASTKPAQRAADPRPAAAPPETPTASPRVRSIAEAAPARTVAAVKVVERNGSGAMKSRKSRSTNSFSDQMAYWRAQDRKAHSQGAMFWVEMAVLVLLLVGASWGVVYFATQPVAGLR
jgi:hypothetical protein